MHCSKGSRRQRELMRSVCVHYGSFANAAELLEHNHGAFWCQLFRLRSLLDEVIAFGDADKGLANRFTQSASLFRNVLDVFFNAESQRDRACHLNIQLQNVVVGIRKLSRFLQPDGSYR